VTSHPYTCTLVSTATIGGTRAYGLVSD